jgi:hypothetical protein
MKTTFAVIGLIVLLIGGGIILKVVFFPVNTATKLIDTAYGVQDKTLNADNAIYNYEWFKQQKEDIDALGRKYQNAGESYDSYLDTISGEKTFEDKTEIARLNTVKLGIKNQLEQAIADYNARTKMANRAIFQNSILPDYIDALVFIKK